MNKKFLQKNIILFLISFILIISVYSICEMILQNPSTSKLDNFNIYINNELINDTNIEAINLQEKLKMNNIVVFEKTIESTNNTSIALYTRHVELEVFENDVKIYEYNRDSDKTYKIVDNRYHIINLSKEGTINLKIVQKVTTPGTVDDFKPVFIGNSNSIIKMLLNNNFVNLTLSIILIIAGITLSLVGICVKNKSLKKGTLISLGMFTILISNWSLCESGILPLFLKEEIRYKIIENISFFNISIAFLCYIYNVIEKDVKEKIYIKLLISLIAVFNVSVFTLESLDVLSARMLLKGAHLFIIISLLLTITICLKYKTTQTKYLSIGLIYIAIVSLLNLSFFYTEDILKTKTNLNLIIVGTFVFLISVIYGYFKCLSELSLKAKEAEILAKIAYQDSLTGLFNRTKYEMDLDKFKEDDIFRIIFYDLNKLKTTNDTLGHDKGDELIISFAEILKSESELLGLNAYRLGGDEFVIISKNKSKKIIEQFLNKTSKRINENNKTNELEISVSYGIANSDEENNTNIREVIKIADERMYTNKLSKHLNIK